MIWPLNMLAPVASLISTLCGMPGSLLSNSSTNALPAGASRWFVSNAMFWAEICSGAAAAAELLAGLGSAAAGPDAAGAADDTGAPADGLMSVPGIVDADGAGGAYVKAGAPPPEALVHATATRASAVV